MEAQKTTLLYFIRKAPQFVIPIFQRPYSWEDKECEQLWKDLLRSGGDEEVSTHFVGSIVFIEEGPGNVTKQSPLFVIDGQQRVTTVMLLLKALVDRIGDDEPVNGFSAEKLRTYYLFNELEPGDARYKLLLSDTDRDSLLAIVEGKSLPHEPSDRIEANFRYFDQKVTGLDNEQLVAICKGLAKLSVVEVSLERGEDNPQLIFESMNSTGRELSQADLIRNFVLMGLEPEHQKTLYKDHWRPMELNFGQEAYGKYFDGFMRHYLTMKTGAIPRQEDVYEAFKEFSNDKENSGLLTVEQLVADVAGYASHYCRMALKKEEDQELAAAFAELRELRVDVAYPYLLELYDDFAKDRLSKEDFLAAVRLIEAYVFRRSVCAIPTNSLNKTFATAGASLDKENYLESIKAHFQGLATYKKFPNDQEFVRELKQRDLYSFGKSRGYWLRRIENHDRKEQVPVQEYTIEHILPQNSELSPEWQASLGPQWREIQDEWLHTLGNLTLTAYNSQYSDRPFAEKRDMENGFGHSPLRLNEGLGQVIEWTEEEIKARAERLATFALKVWPVPNLPAEVMSKYELPAPEGAAYSIDDHAQLAEGKPMRPLFEIFSAEVCGLDDSITREFMKLYVAFKAETNFVDVVPMASRLTVSLNMDFPEINDPKGVCLDVTNKGHWGNGSVEVHLTSEDELPYLMSLVEQSFEKQIGGSPGSP